MAQNKLEAVFSKVKVEHDEYCNSPCFICKQKIGDHRYPHRVCNKCAGCLSHIEWKDEGGERYLGYVVSDDGLGVISKVPLE